MSASRRLRALKYPSIHPRKAFQDFTKQHLPSNMMFTDIDGVARQVSHIDSSTNKVLLYELKSFGSRVVDRPAQSITFQILHESMNRLSGDIMKVKLNENYFDIKVEYHGFWEICFLGAELDFSEETGGLLINNKKSTKQDLIDLLSFKYKKNGSNRSDKTSR